MCIERCPTIFGLKVFTPIVYIKGFCASNILTSFYYLIACITLELAFQVYLSLEMSS